MPLRYTPDDLPLTLGYALNPLDRMSDQRAEPEWVAERWHAPNARFVVFAGDRVLLRQADTGAHSVTFSADAVAEFGVGPKVARAETGVFLGLAGTCRPRPHAAIMPGALRPSPASAISPPRRSMNAAFRISICARS